LLALEVAFEIEDLRQRDGEKDESKMGWSGAL